MDVLDDLAVPIVQAPMAGGPSTPELAAVVRTDGGLGVCAAGGPAFVAAGYRTPDAIAADVTAVRAATGRPFGVNVFVGGGTPADPAVVAAYIRRLGPEARRAGAELGAPRFDDDDHPAKIQHLLDDPV